MTAKRKRVLLAYTGLPLGNDVFKLACLYAKDSAADLQLLRIHLPEDVMTERVHGEQLYSELKTLHAQLQNQGLPVDLLAEPGRGEEPILNYLARQIVHVEINRLAFVGPLRPAVLPLDQRPLTAGPGIQPRAHLFEDVRVSL